MESCNTQRPRRPRSPRLAFQLARVLTRASFQQEVDSRQESALPHGVELPHLPLGESPIVDVAMFSRTSVISPHGFVHALKRPHHPSWPLGGKR